MEINMTHKYSDAKNAQILIALLKAHNIHQYYCPYVKI